MHVGKAFDELEMNRMMFAHEGVRVRGVVLNKATREDPRGPER